MQRAITLFFVLITCLSVGTSSATAKDRFDPGTRVLVTVSGAAPAERYFVQMNDDELVVLNLSDANLPKRQLLNMTADNPAWIAASSKTTYKDNSVRIGPDGVFVKDKKVADLGNVVEHIPTGRVTSVVKK